MKTSELTGAALDWAVAKCEAQKSETSYVRTVAGKLFINSPLNPIGPLRNFCPSTDWAQGGPIIDRELIAIDYDHDVWNAAKYSLSWYTGGPTPLIAAMRCYVASKLGDEVDVPDELL
jgi:hypothetical protein